jgi:hypothetical protein
LLAGSVVAAFWRAWPLPDPSPVHFGGNGLPDRWGSPWELPLVISLVTLVAIAVSFAVDETWARSERRKRFNWFALIDELFVAFLATVAFQYVVAVAEEPFLVRQSWFLTIGVMIAAGLAAVTLELLRPTRLCAPVIWKGTGAVDEDFEIGEIGGRNWAYWESQNPRYTRWYIPIFGIGLIALGLRTWDDALWAAVLAVGMGLVVLLTCAGGFRVSVTREHLTLRGGLLGLPLLRLALQEIATADVHEFSPLADFGGYGIRRNGQMKAFFLEGNTGVRVTTTGRKAYLLGSERPGRLAAVIRAATGEARG